MKISPKICQKLRRVCPRLGGVLSVGLIMALFITGDIFSQEVKTRADRKTVTAASGPSPAKIIRAGLVEGYPPYSFVGESGAPQGLAVDMANALARHMGLQLDFTIGSRAEIHKAFQEKRLDILLWTPYLKIGDEALEPMPPYAVSSDFIFVREEDSSIQGANFLQDREIIVVEGDIAQFYLVRTKITDRIITAASPLQALEMLSLGTGDALLLPGPTGLDIAGNNESIKVKVLTGPVTAYRRNFFFGIHRGDRELAAILSQGLEQLQESGESGLIYARWHDLPGWDHVSISRLMFYLILAAVGVLAVFAAVFVWGMSQNRKAARRARELAREIGEREAADAELRKHRHHLDQLVAERTGQLESDLAAQKMEIAALQTDTALVGRENREAKEFHTISGLAYWEYDIDRGLVRMSEEAFWLYGRPLKAGQPSFEEMSRYYHDESGRRFRTALKGAAEKGEPFALELGLLLSDGVSRRHFFKGHPVRDTSGRIWLIRAIVQDITVRAEIENDLRQALSEASKIIENMSMAIITLDNRLTVTGINRVAERLFSLSAQKVLGKNLIDEAFPEFKKTELEGQLRNVLDGRRTTPFEFSIGGSPARQWYSADICPLNDGLVVYICGISEKKGLEESLNESETRFQRLFNGFPYPALLIRYRDGVTVNINRSGELFFGMARQEIIGRTDLELRLWENQEERLHFLNELRRQGDIAKREFLFNRIDGTVFRGRLSAVLIPLGGQWHVAAFLEDQGLAKKVENELRQTHEILDNIMEFSPTIIFSTTARGIVKSSSRNLESVLQKEGPEIIGRNISEFWPSWPSVQPNSEPGISDRFFDFELVQPIGKEMRTYWVRLIPLAEAGGDGSDFLVLAEDISPRLKQIEVMDNYAARVSRAEADAARLSAQLESIGKTQENDYLMPVIYEEKGV